MRGEEVVGVRRSHDALPSHAFTLRMCNFAPLTANHQRVLAVLRGGLEPWSSAPSMHAAILSPVHSRCAWCHSPGFKSNFASPRVVGGFSPFTAVESSVIFA